MSSSNIPTVLSNYCASPSSNYCTKSSSIYYAILNLTTPQIKVTKAKISTDYTSEGTNKRQLSNDNNSIVGSLNEKVPSESTLIEA